MTPAPTHRIEPLPVAAPGVVALRSHSDRRYPMQPGLLADLDRPPYFAAAL